VLELLAGFLVGVGLMVEDEVLTLAMYCGRSCVYPVPLLGDLRLYQAEGLAWILVLAGVVLLTVSLRERVGLRRTHTQPAAPVGGGG
jgi:hypothetical protein